MAYTVWGFAIVLALVAGWIDFRSHRVPNWLTLSGFSVGIVVHMAFGGWSGAKGALLGAGIPLAILFPIVFLRGMGAGDWKLVGALGAVVGKEQILQVLFAAIIFAGLIATMQMIREKRVFVTLRNLWELIRGFVVFGLKPHPEINLENPEASALPFGVAVAAATLVCCGMILAGI
jgi:prepilin peptidase CpaA